MSTLVAGGTDCIDAYVIRLLLERGKEIAIIDDLSYGTPERVKGASLIELDVASDQAPQTFAEVVDSHGVTAVTYLAARKQAGESVGRPAWYYQQNIGGLASMLLAMGAADIKQMIFSSPTAVYGIPPVRVVPKDIDCRPIDSYGETRLAGEWMMTGIEKAQGLCWTDLRYFNVVGAGWGGLGDMATLNLIPMVLDRLARGEAPKISGTDYPTPDGTCVRDYIHVKGPAVAHIAALDYLTGGQEMAERVFDVGTGQGASARKVVSKVIALTDLDLEPEELARRAGDPPQLIDNATRIDEVLGWKAEHDLDDIVASSCTSWQADPNRSHFG